MKEKNLESLFSAHVVLAANLDVGGGGAQRGSEFRKINLDELGEAARIPPARVRAAWSPPAECDSAEFVTKPFHRLPYSALSCATASMHAAVVLLFFHLFLFFSIIFFVLFYFGSSK